MKQTVIPGTDICVSRIGFGSASLHHLFSGNARQSLLRSVAAAGIAHFDTSPYYGYGLAESDLGRFIRGQRASLTLATKVGLYPCGYHNVHAAGVWTRKVLGKLLPKLSLPVVNWLVTQAQKSLDGSLRRLGTDYVDFLFLHEPDLHLINLDEFLAWLVAEKTAGRIRAWGVAGVADRVSPFVRARHQLAMVVQTRDSLDQRQADFMAANGRSLQFTYGYLSGSRLEHEKQNRELIMHSALERNQTGTVLVSTRSAERISLLTRAAT